MKLAPILLLLLCFTNVENVTAKEVNFTITDQYGCEWHVVGTINFTLTWSGLAVSDYDLTVTNCRGEIYEFSGLAVPPSGEEYNPAYYIVLTPEHFQSPTNATGPPIPISTCTTICYHEALSSGK